MTSKKEGKLEFNNTSKKEDNLHANMAAFGREVLELFDTNAENRGTRGVHKPVP
jgi:hypothetical protein